MGRAGQSWKKIGALALFCVLLAGAAPAEIYRWVDAEGRVHFTEDIRQVPPAQRPQAEQKPSAGAPSPVQVYSAPAARRRSTPSGSAAAAPSGPVHRIRVQSAGSSMRVMVRINGRLDVPFLIDTGATDVVLPKWAADELGLDLENARTGRYSTANGIVTQKLVRLDSVALQSAEVENVPATVSSSMSQGLLGLSFFNHFHYNVDPGSGLVTLRPNGLAERGVLRGGKSEHQWRQHFAVAQARVAQAEQQQAQASFGRSRELKARVEQLERELQILHREADEARVPYAWRH